MTATASSKSAPSLTESFILSMRRLAASVTIITINGKTGPSGMTASAVSSLSAEPPAVLACVNKSTSMHDALEIGHSVCINLLSDHQNELCFAFGGTDDMPTRFAQGDWKTDKDEPPYLADAHANLFCKVDRIFDYETHSIIVCKVHEVRLDGDVRPLIYCDGGFITSNKD